MKTIKTMILVSLMLMMMVFGGIATTNVVADEPETVVVEEIAEPTEEVSVEEETEDVVDEETVEVADDTPIVEEDKASTPAEIIARDTNLVVDNVKQFDSYGDWSAYEVYADGDIYVVTVKGGSVDVVAQLN